jgi:hypothetical protein
MITTDKGQSAEQVNLARDEPETRFGGSRRSLLSGAASGFALAASGLLLPEWLAEEAAADNHPVRGVQDRKQHKRDKRRHKREHNRQLKNRQRGGKGSRGGILPDGVKVTVVNRFDTSNIPGQNRNISFTYWHGTVGWVSDSVTRVVNAGGGTETLETNDLHAGILFAGGIFAWVESPVGFTPNTTLQYGGTMTTFGYYGGTIAFDHTPLSVGQETRVDLPFGDVTAAFTVRRNPDAPDFKVFTISISKA